MFTGPRLDRRGNLKADSGHICITMTLGSRGASAASFRPMDKLQPCRAYVPPQITMYPHFMYKGLSAASDCFIKKNI